VHLNGARVIDVKAGKLNNSSNHTDRVQQLQTEILYSNSKVVVFGQLVIGSMMFFYLWGTLAFELLEYWLSTLLLLIGFRIVLNYNFQKRRYTRTDLNWHRIYAFISLLSGLTWRSYRWPISSSI